jgi:sodium/hydrogen antiporter
MANLDLWLALLAAVLTIAALVSGLVDRAPLSFPILFLVFGLALGQAGLGILTLDPRQPALVAVATVSLALVLFLDAVNLQVDELRRDWRTPVLSLGPGTLLTVAGVAAAAHLLLNTPVLQSLLLGAILASTDPIILRDVVRNERIPRSIRRALTVEAGMNDVVLLPIILTLIAVVQAQVGSVLGWVAFFAQLLVLSPAVGLVVGGVGALSMGRTDAWLTIRREYQSLYGLGLVLAAYTAAQAVGGDGFLAAFFAGLAVAIFDVSLCDCFLEYGEVTAEMLMLLAFMLFGAALSPLLGTVPVIPVVVLAIIALVVVRPVAMALALWRAKVSGIGRAFIGWFGPRGLSSLLLALLVVEAGAPDAVRLLTITGIVVLISALAHGATATPLSAWYGRRVAHALVTLGEEREGTAGGLFQGAADGVPRITPQELAQRLATATPPLVLDVRTRAQYDEDGGQIPTSVRVLPDQLQHWAATASHARTVVAYCT